LNDTSGRPRVRDLDLKSYAGSIALCVGSLGVGLLLQRANVAPADVGLLFLTSVFLSAVWYGRWPALLAALFSTLAYNFFFFPPLYTFTIADPANVLTVFFFGFVAVVAGNLAARMRAQASAAETERLRAALLTSISHDLRTPLASIIGAASSLKSQRDILDAPAERVLIDTIVDEAERLNRFISNLLDMTRLESGAIKAKLETVDVSDVVGSALRRAGPVLESHPLEIDIAADLPALNLDPVLFEQVLFNLLDNAAKYSKAGTRIAMGAYQTDNKIAIAIADEGDGIAQGDLENIFGKFYRVQVADRQRAGTGLGLAICRGFVESMGGTIAAANRSDRKGAIFTIILPVPADVARKSTA
jgi:K+-sensing histidine kinase KdpD